MKRITFCLVCVLTTCLAKAQTGSISGTITTSDGGPAAFVNVLLKETNQGSSTAEDGTFRFENITEGDYTIVTSFIGLASQSRTVSVSANRNSVVNFTLEEDARQLSEIIITDNRSMNDKPASIGKTYLKPMDLPQSVMVLDRQVLEKQQSLRLSDVLMNTNGVYVMGATGGTQEEIAGRGFAYGSNNTFKNGARFNNTIMPEISSLERVEVLKGSNAILFGNVAAGGVLNLVTKKPKFDKGGEISFRTGSYDMYKPSLDVYGAVNNSEYVAYRVNTSYENSGSFRDEVTGERIYFNPSFLIKAGDRTDIIIEGDYLKDGRTLDYGTGAIDYEIIDLPRNTFLGAKWSYFEGIQKSTTLTVAHDLSDKWQIRSLTSYQAASTELFGTTRPNSGNFVQPDGLWKRGLQRTAADQKYFITQLDALGKVQTGSVDHNLLIGADLDSYENKNLAYVYRNPELKNANVYDSINVFDLSLYEQRTDIPTLGRNTLTTNPVRRHGFYAQDLIGLTSYLKVLAGLRYSVMESESEVYNYASAKTTKTTFTDDAFSPRFGIVYQPSKLLSIFTSYANSFTLNTGIDSNGDALPPSIIDQIEAGVKSELLKGLVSANLTVYKIINSNLSQPVLATSPDFNPDYPNAQELAGEVTSKGVELDLMSKNMKGFTVIAGYSYNDTRYTESKQYIEGSKLRYNPAHTANGSLFYSVASGPLKGLQAGFIAFYMGERMGGRSTQVTVANDTRKLIPVESYFQFDASAGYTYQSVTLRAKVSNVLNELSYNVHDDNSINPIAPRMFTTTVSYKF